MKSKKEVAKQFRKHKGASDKGLSAQWQNTKDCQSFYAGNFMDYTDSLVAGSAFGNVRSIPVQFSLVKPYINSVRGFFAQNRVNMDYVAKLSTSQGQQLYSQYINALKDSVRENANADQIETQVDGDLLVCGYGAMETDMSYGEGEAARNANGEILMSRLDPRDIGWDAGARKSNLLDRRFNWYRRIYELDMALDLFQGSDEEDFEEAHNDENNQKQYYPAGGKYDKIQDLGTASSSDYDWEDQDEKLVKVYFYQWYEIETFYRAVNPLSNIQDPQAQQYFSMELEDIAQWANQDADEGYELDPRAKIISCDSETKGEIEAIFEDAVDFEPFKRKVFYTAILSGSHVFKIVRNKSQKGFTVQFKTGDFDETNKIWVGMVNSLRDPVLYYNKALTELMILIASQAKGGAYVEESALIGDIRDFESAYAKTDGVILVADGAISSGKIQPKKESFSDGGLNQLVQLTEDAIDRAGGIDRGFFSATGDDNETASLHRQRIRQAMTILATYFDNIMLFKKEHAQLLLPLMRELVDNNDGSMFKAIMDDGTLEYLQMNPANFTDEYDVSIQEAPDSATLKDQQAQAIMAIAAQLYSAGDMQSAKKVTSVGIKYMSLDFQDQLDIIQTLMPPQDPQAEQEQQELQQQTQQLTMQTGEAKLKETLSKAALNMVTGQEKISTIRKNNSIANQTNVETKIISRQPVKTDDVRVNA